jgi:nitroreductase
MGIQRWCDQGGRPVNGDSTEVKQALADAADAARRAPSVHNTQPWRWVVHADRLELFAVRDRQLREQDPEGRLLLISCGTALHHAEIALEAEGWQYQVDRPADEPLAVIRLGPRGVAEQDATRRLALTELRYTDRRTVSEKPLAADVLGELTAAARDAGARLDVLRRDQVLELAVTVEHAEQAAGSDERLRAELARWVGGDRPGGTGLPDSAIPAELPLTTVTERDFGQAGDLDPGGGHDSAATYAVLYGDGDEPVDWIRAGEALSALWLAATEHGASVLPFSSPIELPFTRQALRRMLAGVGYPYLALRLGAIDAGSVPPPHTPRLAAQQVIEFSD